MKHIETFVLGMIAFLLIILMALCADKIFYLKELETCSQDYDYLDCKETLLNN